MARNPVGGNTDPNCEPGDPEVRLTMPRLSTALLKPGMELAEDVNAPGGQRIAGTGAILTDKHLAAFRTWGIAMVQVAEGAAAAIDPALLSEARRRVAPRFAGQPTEHPAVRELFRIAVDRTLVTMLAAAEEGKR